MQKRDIGAFRQTVRARVFGVALETNVQSSMLSLSTPPESLSAFERVNLDSINSCIVYRERAVPLERDEVPEE